MPIEEDEKKPRDSRVPKPKTKPESYPQWMKDLALNTMQGMENVNMRMDPVRYALNAVGNDARRSAAQAQEWWQRITTPDPRLRVPNPYRGVQDSVDNSREAARTSSSGNQDVDLIRKILLLMGVK